MAAQIELYLDIVNNRLVQGLNSREAFTFGKFYQGSNLPIRLFPLVPLGGRVVAPFYAKVALDNITQTEFAIGARAGAEALLVYQGTWTAQTSNDADNVSGYLYANVDLNTTELNAAIGSSDTYSTFVEIKLSESGVKRVVYQESISITSVVLGPGAAGSAPTPAVAYLTLQEAMGMFVKWANLDPDSRGKSIILSSPDGTATREIGVNNDKSGKDELT